MGAGHSIVLEECKRVTKQQHKTFLLEQPQQCNNAEQQKQILGLLEDSNINSIQILDSDLVSIPNMSSLVNKLSVLTLTRSYINSVEIERLPNTLTTLTLASNAITGALTCDFGLLVSLKYLDMSDNLIDSIDCPLPPSLQTLMLEGNQLRTLDLSLSSQLVSLNINMNNFKTLPADLPLSMDTIHCQRNVLRSITGVPVSLKHLYCNNNQLLSIDSLSECSSLKVLAAQHNMISKIDPDVFQKMTLLQTLSLNDNILYECPKFSTLVSLKRLMLHENLLTAISDLSSCVKLHQLRVEYNKLKSLPELPTTLCVLFAHNNLEDLQVPAYLSQLVRVSTRAQHDLDAVAAPEEGVRAPPQFSECFQSFLKDRDYSRKMSKHYTLSSKPAEKLALMRQYRNSTLDLWVTVSENLSAAENVSSEDVVSLAATIRGDKPNIETLRRLQESLKDALWCASFIELGGVETLITLLHKLYSDHSAHSYQLVALPITLLSLYQILKLAPKSILEIGHTALPILLLHLASEIEGCTSIVVQCVFFLVNSLPVGSPLTLQALDTRQKLLRSKRSRFSDFCPILHNSVPGEQYMVLAILNTLIATYQCADRVQIRREILSLDPVGPREFLESLRRYGESSPLMKEQAMLFIESLKQDVAQLKKERQEEGTPVKRSSSPAVRRAAPSTENLETFPIAVLLPSGETRSITLALEFSVQDVLETIASSGVSVVVGTTLKITGASGKVLQEEGGSLAAQGVEPFTVLQVITNSNVDKQGKMRLIRGRASTVVGDQEFEIDLGDVEEEVQTAKLKESTGGMEGEEDASVDDATELDMSLWEEPRNERYIVIENGTITSATLNKIVERVTSTETLDSQLLDTVLSTYRSFCSADQIFEKLVERYEPPDDLYPPDEVRKIRMRVCIFLKKFLEQRSAGDVPPTTILRMVDFLDRIALHLPEMKDMLFKLLTIGSSERAFGKRLEKQPKPVVPKQKQVEKLKFLDIDPLEMARQISLMTWERYSLINPRELFESAWTRKNGDVLAPNLVGCIELFNDISRKFITMIVGTPRLKMRAKICERLVIIADKCRGLRNYLMLMSIVSVFASSSISRLKHTLGKMSEDSRAILDCLQSLMNPTKSFQKYRAAFAASPGGIPYLGVYLTDLTFIQEGTPNMLGPRINIQKHKMVAELLEKVIVKDKRPLNLANVPIICKYLENLPVNDSEADLYKKSLELEPRGSDLRDIK